MLRLCSGHYSQHLQGKELSPLKFHRSFWGDTCQVKGCDKAHHSKGFCSTHYGRSRNGADLEAPVRNKLAVAARRGDEGTYLCLCCKLYFPKSEFNTTSTGGLVSNCKICATTSRHGLTRVEYLRMVDEQSGKCFLCEQPHSSLTIDHNHSCCDRMRSCGKCVRKLLCGTCNSGLGFFRDSPELLVKATQYLKDHNAG